jgi:hypothetical protein
MAENSIKMDSDGKGFNMKVLRIIQMDDFDTKIILIQGCMQKIQSKLHTAAMHGRVIRAGIWII